MKSKREQGMTILEVAIALTILLIGIGFIMKTDAVSHKYSHKGRVREQMFFYASGILEAQIEGVTPTVDFSPFNDFEAVVSTTPKAGNDNLELVQVRVFLRSSPTDPEPMVVSTYRVKE